METVIYFDRQTAQDIPPGSGTGKHPDQQTDSGNHTRSLTDDPQPGKDRRKRDNRERIGQGEQLLVINNFTDQVLTRNYSVPDDARLLIGNYDDDEGQTLRPYEAKVYQF